MKYVKEKMSEYDLATLMQLAQEDWGGAFIFGTPDVIDEFMNKYKIRELFKDNKDKIGGSLKRLYCLILAEQIRM